MNVPPEYLGDSVYVEWDGESFILTTHNGHDDDPRNVIMLEPLVLAAFGLYLERVREAMAEEKKKAGR